MICDICYFNNTNNKMICCLNKHICDICLQNYNKKTCPFCIQNIKICNKRKLLLINSNNINNIKYNYNIIYNCHNMCILEINN